MTFADIHCHALFGVDDGARTEEDTYALLDTCYRDGIRFICFTPHFHLGYFGNNYKKISQAFSKAENYAKIKYPDLALSLGNELRYSQDAVSRLEEGLCRTMGDTDLVLVDFSEREHVSAITNGLHRLLNAGYTPILAHAERYGSLTPRDISAFREDGVLIQLDTQSLFGGFGFRTKQRAGSILRRRIADIVASDAHDLRRRPPGITEAYHYIEKKYGRDYAQALCRDNALQLLWPEAARKV